MAFSSAAKITHEYVQALTSVREQSSRNIEASRSIVRQEVFDCSQYFDHLHVGYRELKHSMASLEVETMKADLATCVHNISQICTKMHRLEQVLDTLCERRDKDLVTVWQERKALELDKLQHRHKEEYHRREAQLNAQRVNQQRFHRVRSVGQ